MGKRFIEEGKTVVKTRNKEGNSSRVGLHSEDGGGRKGRRDGKIGGGTICVKESTYPFQFLEIFA